MYRSRALIHAKRHLSPPFVNPTLISAALFDARKEERRGYNEKLISRKSIQKKKVMPQQKNKVNMVVLPIKTLNATIEVEKKKKIMAQCNGQSTPASSSSI